MRVKHSILLLILCFPTLFHAQVNIPSRHFGISIGNSTRFTGLRLNFRDKYVEQINGINITAWSSKDEYRSGTVNGLALGVPVHFGSDYLIGVSIGLFGVGAGQQISGIQVGGLGVGAGEDVKGISIGGLGVGAGGSVSGFNFGGLGIGAGGNVSGISIGGLGAGAGGNMTGFNFGGLGVGAGGNLAGFNIGGLGVGSGGKVTGVSIGGLGVGAAETVTGLNVAVLGIGAGQAVRGVSVAGVGIGAPRLSGIQAALVTGAIDMRGLTVAPAYNRVGDRQSRNGTMGGLAVSSYNHIMGLQKGFTIGILNIADQLDGFQIGLINIARSNREGLRVLPVFNGPFR